MRLLRSVLVVLALLAVLVWGYARLTSGSTSTTETFGDSLRTFQTSGSSKVALSPDATRLALVQDGTVTVVRIRDAAVLSRAGTNVVDVAWMADSVRVLIDEGPIPTGEVAVLGADGRVAGSAQLHPSIGFGDGQGLAVNDKGTLAAAIAVVRDPIGGREHTDVAVIDLQTGRVRVFATPETNESRPVFVDDTTIAYAAYYASSGHQHLSTVDAGSGETSDFGVISDGPFVVTPADEVVVSHRAGNLRTRLVAVDLDSGRDRQLGMLAAHREPLAIDRNARRAIVRVVDKGNGVRIAVDPIG